MSHAHRNGCTGCPAEDGYYAPCWTRSQIAADGVRGAQRADLREQLLALTGTSDRYATVNLVFPVLKAVHNELDSTRDELAKAIEERDDARSWACHGYEIGQRSATWSDQGVAPSWLLDSYKPKPPVCKGIEGATGISCQLDSAHPGDHEGNHEPSESVDYPMFVRWPRNQYDGKRVAPAADPS